MKIVVFQGNDHQLPPSDITIVIDVIRAFTVAHYAFMKGAEKILLVGTVEEAFQIKKQHPQYLLAGEIKGLPIEGFDLDNSPANIVTKELVGQTLVQKTTNGVKATLNSLAAKNLYVTGFSNARTTANYIKKIAGAGSQIHIVASHPEGDDDMACAEFMKGIIEGRGELTEQEVRKRIRESVVTGKFFDPAMPEFNPDDIAYCMKEMHSDFLMKVNKTVGTPMIERFLI